MKVTPEQIDELLPQTQCGLCTYGACMPYAEAIVFEQAAINLCPPGGVKTLKSLANLLQQDASPFILDMEKKTKSSLLAVIREDECIGCTKCIQACPVDAILGSAKEMHTVITAECTGCELCVAPCPVDCIDMLALSIPADKQKMSLARQRFNAREMRLAKEKRENKMVKQAASTEKNKIYIQAALERARSKKEKNK